MAKKKASSSSPHGAKSAAIRDYLQANKNAKGPDVVAALKEQGVSVSVAMVYAIKAKSSIKKAKRGEPAEPSANGAAPINKARGLEATLTLYRAAKGAQVPAKQVSGAFLALVEMLS